jgi:hypothetical protein
MGRDAAEHRGRGGAEPFRPELAHQFVIAADTAARHENSGCLEREVAVGIP